MAKIELRLSAMEAAGKSELLIRFSISRDIVLRAKGGIMVQRDLWDDKNRCIRLNSRNQGDMMLRLSSQHDIDDLCNAIMTAYSSIIPQQANKAWLEEVIARHNRVDDDIPVVRVAGFESIYDDFLLIHCSELSVSRNKRYRCLRGMIQRFCAFSGKEPDVNSMNAEWVSHFEDYLKKEHLISKDTRYSFLYKNAREILPRSQNHMTTILSALRAFLKWCNLQGYCKVDPFSKIRIRAAVYGTPYYLTLNEMEDLYNFDFSSRPGLQAQRDIFIFQCCIGCRVGDLVRLTSANIVDGAVEYVPRKTKDGSATIVRVPLNETASGILLKYHTIDKREPLFPFISIQKYNEAIKEMFQIAGLNRIVSVLDPLTRLEVQKPLNEVASSHLARRTFIGNLYRQVQDPNLIGALSGHTEGSKAFSRYHDIDEGMKRKLVALLDTKPVEAPEEKLKKVPRNSSKGILN